MTDSWGVQDGYLDIHGGWNPTADAARDGLHRVFGRTADMIEPPSTPRWWVVRHGESHGLWNLADLELEDGTVLHGVSQLPVDLPIGYHWLRPVDGWPASRLLVTPPQCRQPERSWGWSVQLYGLRSATNLGHGNLGDLAQLGAWATTTGASYVQINPLSSPSMTAPIEPSPYMPSTRRYRSPLYLDVAALPGADTVASDIARIAAAQRDAPTIDRERVAHLVMPVLRALAMRGATNPEFVAWRVAHPDVEQYGLYEALAARHGPNWLAWPTELQHPDRIAVRAGLMAEFATEITAQAWMQWQLDVQLRRAAATSPLMGDLPVGVSNQGYDAWCWQDVFALGASIGAPPDLLAPQGQDWGLPPFTPWKLRAAGYRPFIDTIRASLVGFAGLRIDHVLGLFRLWCNVRGEGVGAYVEQDTDVLLGIIRVETHRAGAFCVGEDLGTIAPSARDDLRQSNILGCSVAWFEDDAPLAWRTETLASIGTHDLATAAGLVTGADLEARRRYDLPVNEAAYAGLQGRAITMSGKPIGTPWEDTVVALHEAAAASPAVLFSAATEDACGLMTPMNVPGTIDEWPNWRQWGADLDALATSPLTRSIAEAAAVTRPYTTQPEGI
jgi:4-alpha-glucanotransferase